jgi:hypothetical protein
VKTPPEIDRPWGVALTDSPDQISSEIGLHAKLDRDKNRIGQHAEKTRHKN